MTIYLDHTIVPSKDKEKAARFFARIFGLSYRGFHLEAFIRISRP